MNLNRSVLRLAMKIVMSDAAMIETGEKWYMDTKY